MLSPHLLHSHLMCEVDLCATEVIVHCVCDMLLQIMSPAAGAAAGAAHVVEETEPAWKSCHISASLAAEPGFYMSH